MLRGILLAATLILGVVVTQANAASAMHGDQECPEHWWKGRWHVKKLVKCVAWHEDVSTGTAVRVARCESRFDPSAHSSGNAGVYQHAVKYWKERAAEHGFKGWSVYNGRANVYVALRMADEVGWSPWSCY